MLTSTPEGRRVSRRSLVLPSPNATPLRRSFIAQPVVELERLHDDEGERSARRNLVDTHRRVSNIRAQEQLNTSNKFSGEQEIKDHFQICSKLYSDGKITARNAWQLHIIDIIKHMSKKGGPNSFQVAGTSLDIGAKVYAIRVDDIYADGMKLASSISKNAQKGDKNNENEDNMDCEEAAPDKENKVEKKKKKKKTLRIGDKVTVAKDVNTLSGPLPKLESVYFSSRIRSDATAVDNLASNQIRMDKAGYKLLTEVTAWTNCNETETRCNTKFTLQFKPLSRAKICETFDKLEIDEWDPDKDDKEFSQCSKQDEMVVDENGFPIAELDGSIHDIFENNDNDAIGEPMMDAEEEIIENVAPLLRGEVEHIVEIRPAEAGSHARSEYSYNMPAGANESTRIIEQIWAGPSHWKLKYIRRSKVRFSGVEGQVTVDKPVKQGRKKAPPAKISFDELKDFDINVKLKGKRKPPTVDPLKTVLPIPDFSFLKATETMQELSSKPGVCPVQRNPKQDEVNVDVANYNYDNLNDSQYCSQGGNNDDGDVPFDHGDDNGDDVGFTQEGSVQAADAQTQNFMGDNLVDAPEAVPKMNIFYAMQPKVIDMKRLKSAVWQILTGKSLEISKQKHPDIQATTFSEVFKKVPFLLPDRMRKDLTYQIVFLSILFLCNEHNLELKQRPDCRDCDIMGPITAKTV